MTSEIEDISGGDAPRLWQKPFATQPVKTKVANGVSSSNDTVGTETCRYAWGAGTGHFKLDVALGDPSRAYLGASPDRIKHELQTRVKAGTADEVITDVLLKAAASGSKSPPRSTAQETGEQMRGHEQRPPPLALHVYAFVGMGRVERTHAVPARRRRDRG